MKNRLSSRLRLTLSGVTLLTLLLMCVLVFAGMYFQTTADNREQLRQQAVQLSAYLEASDDPVSLLQGSVFTQRVTYLDTDGTVLYDSEVDASRLESHAGREEFQQARENGEAFTARSSATLGQTSLYYAKRLADGRVRHAARNAAAGARFTGVSAAGRGALLRRGDGVFPPAGEAPCRPHERGQP